MCMILEEPVWELEMAGGRLGEISDLFCPLQNISMLVTDRHMSRNLESLWALHVTLGRGQGWCVHQEVSECTAVRPSWVSGYLHSPPPATDCLTLSRAASCSICIPAELITQGRRLSVWTHYAWLFFPSKSAPSHPCSDY